MSAALELLGLAAIAIAGFLVAPWVGFACIGAALLLIARGVSG